MEESNIENLKTQFQNFLNSDDDESDIERCLISNNPLEINYITLNCNHKFNYKNIYNEVCKQKCKINPLYLKFIITFI